jgi:putative nucleotidyltransferase with HDIG domain
MPGNSEYTVLAANGEQPVRDLIAREITRLGWKCRPVGSAQEALGVAGKETVHLAFLARKLPDMDGPELLRQLHDSCPDLAPVLISGNGSGENADRIREYGFFDALSLPADTGKLAVVARSALERRQLIIENRYYRENVEKLVAERTQSLNRSNRFLESNLLEMIRTFAGLLEKRDEFVGSHSKRVAAACRAVCQKFDLRDSVRKDIETGALLHDIGKIGLPDPILRKSNSFFEMSKLGEEEKKHIRLHPVIGQEAVEMIKILNPVSLIIRHHHELFNGSGYPDQLSGYNIPLGARIITVVDAYDKVVYSIETQRREAARRVILTHLIKNAGILYDPDVVEIFVAYIQEQAKQISRKKERCIPLGDLLPGMVLSRDLCTVGGMLLVSQNETVSKSDYSRIMRFRQRNAVADSLYIYDAPAATTKKSTAPIGDAAASPREESSGREVNREEIVTFQRFRDAIDQAKGLGTLPTVYQSAVALLNDPTSTRKEIADVLKQDQAIVLKVLRLVNSPLFAFSRRITSIEDAIPLLGFSEIRNIVTSVSVLSMFSTGEGSDTFDRAAFWKHSAACGIVCKILSRKLKVAAEEEYFTAALLHDIGKLVFDQLFPEDFRRVIALVGEKSLSIRQAERMVFGRPHMTFGEYLLRKWKIPEILSDAVLYHHAPRDSKIDPFLVSAVCVSDRIVHTLHIGSSGEKQTPELDEFAGHQLGIGPEDIDALIPEIEEHIRQSDDILKLGD